MTRTVTFDELPGLEGAELGTSGWTDVHQARIDTFADATDDHQWIHVDPSVRRTDPSAARSRTAT